MGALCIYVLLGMLWAFGYGAIGAFESGPFFAEQATANVSDFLYFSFVTLTTVGYGDLTAAGGLGRAIAVVEALFGQLYLVTVVALVVSRMARMAPVAAVDRRTARTRRADASRYGQLVFSALTSVGRRGPDLRDRVAGLRQVAGDAPAAEAH